MLLFKVWTVSLMTCHALCIFFIYIHYIHIYICTCMYKIHTYTFNDVSYRIISYILHLKGLSHQCIHNMSYPYLVSMFMLHSFPDMTKLGFFLSNFHHIHSITKEVQRMDFGMQLMLAENKEQQIIPNRLHV